jgi:hypothetical protein
MSGLLELADDDLVYGGVSGLMGLGDMAEINGLADMYSLSDLGAKLTAEQKAAAAADRRAKLAAKKQQHATAAAAKKEAARLKREAAKTEKAMKKKLQDEAKAAKKADKDAAAVERDARKHGGQAAEFRAKTAKLKNVDIPAQVRKKASLSSTVATLKANLAHKGRPVRGTAGLFGCCLPGLIGMGAAADCTTNQYWDDASGTCIDISGGDTGGGAGVPSGFTLPELPTTIAPKGCDGGAHPNRKDCRAYNDLLTAIKQWYEMTKILLASAQENARLEAIIEDLKRQLEAAQTQTSQCQYGIDQNTQQCLPPPGGFQDGGFQDIYGGGGQQMPGGGGFEPVAAGAGGPSLDEGGLPSDYKPFTGGGGPAGEAGDSGGYGYSGETGEPRAYPADQYADPREVVETMPPENYREEASGPEDVNQGEEPVSGGEEDGAVNDFVEESEYVDDYMSGMHGMGITADEAFKQSITALDKANELYMSTKCQYGYNPVAKMCNPKPVMPVLGEGVPWSQILLLGGIGLLGYALYKKSQAAS